MRGGALRFTLGVVAAALLVAPATSLAAPSVTGEFDLPPATAVGSNNEITAGPDGNMWVTVDSENAIVKVMPDGTTTRFDPLGMAHPATGITAGPDGNLWAAQGGSVLRIPPGDPDTADETNLGGAAGVQGITVGQDGNIWLAGTNVLIKVPPADPSTFTSYPVTLGSPKGMTTGSDGLLWIADGPNVVSATTADPPVLTPYAVGIDSGGTQDVGAGPNGQVAYANPVDTPQNVGLISPGGTPQKIELENTDPFGVTFGQDGAYWISRFQGNDLLRLTTDGQVTTLGGFSPGAGPRKIATGPGNTLWTTLDGADKIGRVSGVEPPPPPPGGGPGPAPPPETKIDKAPKRKVKISKRKHRAKVKLKFSSTAGATFECTLARKGKQPKSGACTSPRKYKLKQGRYKFSVAATLDGVTGPDAVQKFRVVRGK